MSVLVLTYSGATIIDDWNVDTGLSARYAFCYGSAPSVGTIVVATPGQAAIPLTAAISSVVGTFTGVAVDTFSGGRQCTILWLDSTSVETDTIAGPTFVDDGSVDNFQPRSATLNAPGGGWTAAKINGASMGLRMDDQRGSYPARVRWRITTDGGGQLTLATVTFTLAAPTASTVAASNITTTTATLNGTVDALSANANYPVTVHFEWGLTAAYGNSTPNQVITGGSQAVSADIAGLSAALTYHYRVVATNADNTVNSTDATFATIGAAVAGSPMRQSNISPRRRF